MCVWGGVTLPLPALPEDLGGPRGCSSGGRGEDGGGSSRHPCRAPRTLTPHTTLWGQHTCPPGHGEETEARGSTHKVARTVHEAGTGIKVILRPKPVSRLCSRVGPAQSFQCGTHLSFRSLATNLRTLDLLSNLSCCCPGKLWLFI